jgi:hypothetical protein
MQRCAPSHTLHGGQAAQAAQDNAAKVVAGLEAEVACLKGCVQWLEAEAAAAAPELLAVRQDAAQKVTRRWLHMRAYFRAGHLLRPAVPCWAPPHIAREA